MIYKIFFKFLVVTLFNCFLFISCSSSASCDTPDGIAIKLADLSISECLTEKKNLPKAFNEVVTFINRDESIDTILKFTNEVTEYIPVLVKTFVGDEYRFFVFLSEAFIIIRKEYPDATEKELLQVILVCALDLRKALPDSIDTIKKFTEELIELIPISKGIFDEFELKDLLNADTIMLIKFLFPKVPRADLAKSLLKYANALAKEISYGEKLVSKSDFIKAKITDPEFLKILFP